MYSNDPTQIKAALTNFIGAFINSVDSNPKDTKQQTVAVLIEEALKLAQDENKVLDLYIIKPLLKGIVLLFQQRIIEAEKLKSIDSKMANNIIVQYKNTILTVNLLLESI